MFQDLSSDLKRMGAMLGYGESKLQTRGRFYNSAVLSTPARTHLVDGGDGSMYATPTRSMGTTLFGTPLSVMTPGPGAYNTEEALRTLEKSKLTGAMSFSGYSTRFKDETPKPIFDDEPVPHAEPLHPNWEMTKKQAPSAVMGPRPAPKRVELDRRPLGIPMTAVAPIRPAAPKVSIAPLPTTKPRIPQKPNVLGPGAYYEGVQRGETATQTALPSWSFGTSTAQKKTKEMQVATSMGGMDAVRRLLYRRWLRNLAKFEAAMVGPMRYNPTTDVLFPRILYGGLISKRSAKRFPKLRKERPRLQLDAEGALVKTRARSLSMVRMAQRQQSDTEKSRRSRATSVENARLATVRGPGYVTFKEGLTLRRADVGIKNWERTLETAEIRRGRGADRPENADGPGGVGIEFWGLIWRKKPAVKFAHRSHSADPDVRQKLDQHRKSRAAEEQRRGPGRYEDQTGRVKERSSAAMVGPGFKDRDQFAREEHRLELLNAWLRFSRAQPAVGEYDLPSVLPGDAAAPAWSMGKAEARPEDKKEEGEGDTLLLNPDAAWLSAYDKSQAGVVLMEGQFGRGRSFSCPPTVDEDGEGDILLLNPQQAKSRRQPVRFDGQVSREDGVYAIWDVPEAGTSSIAKQEQPRSTVPVPSRGRQPPPSQNPSCPGVVSSQAGSAAVAKSISGDKHAGGAGMKTPNTAGNLLGTGLAVGAGMRAVMEKRSRSKPGVAAPPGVARVKKVVFGNKPRVSIDEEIRGGW